MISRQMFTRLSCPACLSLVLAVPHASILAVSKFVCKKLFSKIGLWQTPSQNTTICSFNELLDKCLNYLKLHGEITWSLYNEFLEKCLNYLKRHFGTGWDHLVSLICLKLSLTTVWTVSKTVFDKCSLVKHDSVVPHT